MPPEPDAWLEAADGTLVEIRGNCSLGRSSSNHVPIPSERASRRHATIHAQDGEFWLIDLGSSNGTMINGRRITQPIRLRDGDLLAIVDSEFTFHQTTAVESGAETTCVDATMVEIRSAPCWLLIGDLNGFTELSQQLSADELGGLVGRWLRACKEAIETRGGTINKYLGDGFLAFWVARGNAAEQVVSALERLRELAATGDARFRIVLHHGNVALGGAAALGEESLAGSEVNFTFRLEKLTGSLGIPFGFERKSRRCARHERENGVPRRRASAEGICREISRICVGVSALRFRHGAEQVEGAAPCRIRGQRGFVGYFLKSFALFAAAARQAF